MEFGSTDRPFSGRPEPDGGEAEQVLSSSLDREQATIIGSSSLYRPSSGAPWPFSSSVKPTEATSLPTFSSSRDSKPDPTVFRSSMHDTETGADKVIEASADWDATQITDGLWPADSGMDPTQPLLVQVPDAIDQVTGLLQSAATSSLTGVATGIGLTSVEATVTAGICSNLVLAPITGPLDQAATFIDLAGIVIGLATGAHPVALVCLKRFVHAQLPKAFARTFIGGVTRWADSLDNPPPRAKANEVPELLQLGPAYKEVDRSQAAGTVERSSESSASPQPPQDAPLLWLCLGFAPRPPQRSDVPHADLDLAAAWHNDMRRVIVLPEGDDEFLRTMPDVLRGSSVSEISVLTDQAIREAPAGHHFIVTVPSVTIGMFGGVSNTQRARQHPYCRTGRCSPPGSRCLCLCAACRSLPLSTRGS